MIVKGAKVLNAIILSLYRLQGVNEAQLRGEGLKKILINDKVLKGLQLGNVLANAA